MDGVILVDTSVWIDVLRGRNATSFIDVSRDYEIATCLPVLQEVLQGFDDDRHFWAAHAALGEFRILEPTLSRMHFEEAADLYRAARREGKQVRSGVDCLIAVCALRNGARLLHRDRDYDKIAAVSNLLVQRL